MAKPDGPRAPAQNPAASALPAAFDRALALHRQGRLAAAERIYGDVLQSQPDHFDALHLLGVVALQTGRPERAAALISMALSLNGKIAAAHVNLGAALRDLQRPLDALASFDNAITLKPDDADAYYNRGNALGDLQRHAEAVASYDQAIALKPDYALALFSRGNALRELKRPADALASYDRAIGLQPDYAPALLSRGNTLQELKRPADALASYDKAISLGPEDAEGHFGRGNVLRELKRHADALASYDRAIALRPNHAQAYFNRGNALRDLGRPEEALASYQRAIALRPNHAEAYYNCGAALVDLRRHQDAIVCYERAIALRPDYVAAHNNRGAALAELNRVEEAIASYDRAIALQPYHAEAHLNRSYCLLQLGRFEQGWREHEWRIKLSEPVAVRSDPQPLWLGDEDIADKTLFIYWEQGLGDTIQFSRYVKLVQARGARVVMSVQRPLVGLLTQLGPAIGVVGPREVPAEYDYRCPLLSLPLALRTTLATIPAEPCYLAADARLRAAWSARLAPKRRPRIGIAWSGSTRHKNDRNRSMGFDQLLPLLGVDADWICLQTEIREKDDGALRQDGRIVFFGDDLRDFSDTAALVDLMDLVITIDTSVAHLAGAMGKPAWILLPFSPDWRWLLDRQDTPWYPSARLFRQRQIGDWASVVERVRSDLRSAIGTLGAP